MKVSIVTVVYNGEKFIQSAIESVLNQDYPDIEYIVIDGASKDRTLEVVSAYKDKIAHVVSEPDQGIYDAMNKGLKMATGEIVGILNADDFYANNQVISRVMQEFRDPGLQATFADLVYVQPGNEGKVTRYYAAKNFKLKDFERGDMPPHPTFFVRRRLYEKYGYFRTDFRIAADFEMMVRLLYKGGESFRYIPEVLVHMREGGISTRGFKFTRIVNQEIQQGLEANGIHSSLLKIYSKYFYKVFQLFRRPGKGIQPSPN